MGLFTADQEQKEQKEQKKFIQYQKDMKNSYFISSKQTTGEASKLFNTVAKGFNRARTHSAQQKLWDDSGIAEERLYKLAKTDPEVARGLQHAKDITKAYEKRARQNPPPSIAS